MINKLVYKDKQTGKKYFVRRIDSIDAVIIDPETKEEKRISQGFLRKNYRFQRKESNPKRWTGDIFKLK
jgi:hypothetical protein